jgi:pimeloyl-ACP methyl ester carboxylesterase
LSDARLHVESLGFHTDLFMVGGRSGVEENAAQIRDFLAEMPPAPGEKLIFVGFSKGAADLLEAVVRYAEVRHRTTAIVSLAGAIGGSPIADSLPDYLETWAETFFGEDCGLEEGGAIESLSREARRDWLAENPLPRSIPYYSVAAFAEREDTSFILRSAYDRLAMVDPLNDGQLIFYDAVIPGSTLLGFVNADHWAVAMPIAREHSFLAGTFVTRNAFPREVLLEAIARFVEEDLLAARSAD